MKDCGNCEKNKIIHNIMGWWGAGSEISRMMLLTRDGIKTELVSY